MIIEISGSVAGQGVQVAVGNPTTPVSVQVPSYVAVATLANTASFAIQALSASYAPMTPASVSSSYATTALTASFALTSVTSSYALNANSASYAPPPEGFISASEQIQHDLTAGYSASRHIDHAAVLMVAGDGLTGGGNISASRTFRLDTGSVRFTEGVKDRLNAESVVTSSAQAIGWTVASASFAVTASFAATAHSASYALNASDGLVSGGVLQINTDTTKFNILGGYGTIIYEPTNIETPQIYRVSWPDSFGLSTPFLTTDTITHVYVDRTGSFVYKTTAPQDVDFREDLYLGYLAHTGKTVINTATTQPFVGSKTIGQLRDLYRALGYVKEGLRITAFDATLGINRGAGGLTGIGLGYTTTPYIPNYRSYVAVTSASFSHRTQIGSGSNNLTVLDVANYDLNGTITPVGGTTSRATNMRVFLTPGGNLVVQYGQTVYDNLADAVAAIPSENFTVYKNLETAALLAIISVRRTATTLSNPSFALITNTGRLSEAVSVGAGLAAIAQYSGSFTGSFTGSATASIHLAPGTTARSIQEHVEFRPAIGTGTSSFDYTSGSVFHIAGMTGNGAWNITNVPTTPGRVSTINFVISQGATPYSASSYHINSTPVTVRWPSGNPITGSANQVDVYGLTAIRSGSTWVVLGSSNTFI